MSKVKPMDPEDRARLIQQAQELERQARELREAAGGPLYGPVRPPVVTVTNSDVSKPGPEEGMTVLELLRSRPTSAVDQAGLRKAKAAAAWLCRYGADMSEEQIAAAAGVTRATVNHWLLRVDRRIAGRMESGIEAARLDRIPNGESRPQDIAYTRRLRERREARRSE